MADVRGGDIRQFSVKGREFDVAPEASCTFMLSGFATETKVTGNGKGVNTQTRKIAGIKGMAVSIDPDRDDLEYLQDIQNAGIFVPVNITLASGHVYSGSLAINGDLAGNSGDGKAEMDLLGPKFEKIA